MPHDKGEFLTLLIGKSWKSVVSQVSERVGDSVA